MWKLTKEEGDGYYVVIPQLGKYAFHADGETLEKAIENLEAVKGFLFEKYIKNDTSIPEPINEEKIEYSGKFIIRIPKQLHRILANEAKKEDISLNQYIQFLLTSATVAHSFENVIDSYNSRFERMLKSYEDIHHNYDVSQYNNRISAQIKNRLKYVTKYEEAA